MKWLGRKPSNQDNCLPVVYASLFEQLRDGVLVLDESGTIATMNPAAAHILGLGKEELVGKNLSACTHPTLSYLYHARAGHTVQREIKHGEGVDAKWFELRISPLLADNEVLSGRIVVLHDITERKTIEAELRYTSSHDALTGVYNRMFFEEELERLRVGRNWPVAILAADLDNLKETNDRKGHVAGDEIIRQVANLLRNTLRAGDMVARIGGDEFAVLLPGCGEEVVQRVLNRLAEATAAHNLDNPDTMVSISVGSAVAFGRSDLDLALQQADAEMYAVKNSRKLKL